MVHSNWYSISINVRCVSVNSIQSLIHVLCHSSAWWSYRNSWHNVCSSLYSTHLGWWKIYRGISAPVRRWLYWRLRSFSRSMVSLSWFIGKPVWGIFVTGSIGNGSHLGWRGILGPNALLRCSGVKLSFHLCATVLIYFLLKNLNVPFGGCGYCHFSIWRGKGGCGGTLAMGLLNLGSGPVLT